MFAGDAKQPAQGVEHGALIMRIAQVAPLYESCPPRLYGGTERIVHYLTRGTAPARTRGDAVCERRFANLGVARIALRTSLAAQRGCKDPLDTDYLHFPLFAECWDKTLTTLHGRLDLPDLPVIMRARSPVVGRGEE